MADLRQPMGKVLLGFTEKYYEEKQILSMKYSAKMMKIIKRLRAHVIKLEDLLREKKIYYVRWDLS